MTNQKDVRESVSEVDRLRHVYQMYRDDPSVQARWDIHNVCNQVILREREQVIGQLLDMFGFLPLSEHKILDIGCGSGRVLSSMNKWGANPDYLYGVDLLTERVETARKNYPNLNFFVANAERLDFPNDYFDLVLLFTVFSSILNDNMAHNVAQEVRRVLKPGGAVLWYDFRYNNPRNPHVRGMTKRHIRWLFTGFEARLHTITLLPPLARRLGRLTPVLYPLLAAIPPLRTHYLGLLVKPR